MKYMVGPTVAEAIRVGCWRRRRPYYSSGAAKKSALPNAPKALYGKAVSKEMLVALVLLEWLAGSINKRQHIL